MFPVKRLNILCFILAIHAQAGTVPGKGHVVKNSHAALPKPTFPQPLEKRMEGLTFFLSGEFPEDLKVSRFTGGADWPMEGIDPKFDNPDLAQCVVAKAPIANEFLRNIEFANVSPNQFKSFDINTLEHIDELPKEIKNRHTYVAVPFPDGQRLGAEQIGFRIKNIVHPEKVYDFVCNLAGNQWLNTKKPPRPINARYGYSIKEALAHFGTAGLNLQTSSKNAVEQDWTYFKKHYNAASTPRGFNSSNEGVKPTTPEPLDSDPDQQVAH
jgi:hypothetical protein